MGTRPYTAAAQARYDRLDEDVAAGPVATVRLATARASAIRPATPSGTADPPPPGPRPRRRPGPRRQVRLPERTNHVLDACPTAA